MRFTSRTFPRAAVSSIALLISLMGKNAAAADSFPQKLERVLREHHLIRMVEADQLTAQKQVDVETSAYFPRVGVQSYAGQERIERDVGTSGRFKPRETSVQVNQLLTDFGATGARVDAARSIANKEDFERNLQVQNLLLAAVEAQMKLLKARRTYEFALESETNVRKQTQLESARVEAGRGYATDVLQAKAQLAGAEARRVSASLQLSEAMNRYKAVFGEEAPTDDLQRLSLPDALLPGTEESLDETVQQQNPDTLAALARQQVASSERKAQVNKELMPRIDLQLSRSRSSEIDGAQGTKDDTRMLLRLNWNFDLGMRARYLSDSTAAAVASASAKADYVRVQASEEARSAWANWQMSKARVGYLDNQVNISASFLNLARRERELGRRSLLDLLNGEVALINARSDALSARIDEIIAAFRVMRASGRLDIALFRQPGVLTDASDWNDEQPNSAATHMAKATSTAATSVAEPVIAPAAVSPIVVAPIAVAPVTAAPVTAAPAEPAVRATEPRAASRDSEVLAFVEQWRAAWASRDVSSYLSSYAPDFVPADGSAHAKWVAQRKQRIAEAGDIHVRLNNIRVTRDGSAYVVDFDQAYQAKKYSDVTRKRLVLRVSEGKFSIVQELPLNTTPRGR